MARSPLSEAAVVGLGRERRLRLCARGMNAGAGRCRLKPGMQETLNQSRRLDAQY